MRLSRINHLIKLMQVYSKKDPVKIHALKVMMSEEKSMNMQNSRCLKTLIAL